MISVGDRVQVGSRIGAKLAWGTVVDIIPGNDYRETMYRVRFDAPRSETVTITPNPNEAWIDAPLVYGPFVDQPFGWN